MINSIDSYVDNKMGENNRSNIVVPEDMGEKGNVDEIEIMAETVADEAKQDNSSNLDEYDPSLDVPIMLRKGTRSCTKYSIYNYVSYDNLSPQFKAFTTNFDSTTIPKNIHIALECPKWKTAVNEEMRALEMNKTWELYALPKGHKTMGCKWVFTLKCKAYGTLDRHKASLVSKGFT